MNIFHSLLLFIQLSYLFFYFRYQQVLLENINIVPLSVGIVLNIYLLFFIFFRNLEIKVAKTIHISVYIVFISISSYLYLSFITSSVGSVDNSIYLLFILSIIFFVYYLFDDEVESIISLFTVFLALIYFDNFTSRILSYYWINGDVAFFQVYFNNLNTNFYLYNIIKDTFFASFMFYFIFIYQFIMMFGLFILKNDRVKLIMLSIGIFTHLFSMLLFQNTFYHIIILFIYLPLLVPIFEHEKLFDLKKLSVKSVVLMLIIFITATIVNTNYIIDSSNKKELTRKDSLFTVNKQQLSHKKGISFSDGIVPLEYFSYKQIESMKKTNKGLFSKRYLKVYYNGKKIYSTINPYKNTVSFSPYLNQLLTIFNHYYSTNNPKGDKMFKYLFKKIKKDIVVEQGYLFLENINSKKLSIKVVKITEGKSQDIDLNKDFFTYTVKNNYKNPEFIYSN